MATTHPENRLARVGLAGVKRWFMKKRIAHLLAWAMLLGRCATAAGDDAAGTEFFEKKIRPVLVDRCYACHSRRVEPPKGGLRLDSREAVARGGESGPVIVAGSPTKAR